MIDGGSWCIPYLWQMEMKEPKLRRTTISYVASYKYFVALRKRRLNIK